MSLKSTDRRKNGCNETWAMFYCMCDMEVKEFTDHGAALPSNRCLSEQGVFLFSIKAVLPGYLLICSLSPTQ